MAIERIEQRRGEVTRVDTLLPGSTEKIYPRGFWRTIKSKLRGEDITAVTVISPDKIKVSDIENDFRWPRERDSYELEKNEINGVGVKTGEFGIRRNKILYQWKPSEIEPQDH